MRHVDKSIAEKENKLFIGMLPKTVVEEDLEDLFLPYGSLREVHVIRAADGSPKGCAFIKFVDKISAIAAIEDLNETIPNFPLVIALILH